MASLFDWLRNQAQGTPTASGDTDTVRRIASELDKIEPNRARFLAAFAYVLSRVAGADMHISQVETAEMVVLLQQAGQLPEAQALLVVELAKTQHRLFGGTENFLVTREFRQVASDEERRRMLDCLFAVAVADDELSSEEESQIWQTAGELGFTRQEFVAARLAHSDKRSVLRRDPPPS